MPGMSLATSQHLGKGILYLKLSNTLPNRKVSTPETTVSNLSNVPGVCEMALQSPRYWLCVSDEILILDCYILRSFRSCYPNVRLLDMILLVLTSTHH